MFLYLFSMAAALPPIAPPPVSPAVVEVVRANGSTPDEKTERELLLLAVGGDRSAWAVLGEINQMSVAGRSPDWAKACDYAERAGDHSTALHNLATCWFRGQGRHRDPARALGLYERASALGSVKSHCALGNMLISGIAGRRDVAQGIALCRHAADAGDPDAQTDYGGNLLTGTHLERDPVAARKYLSAAAERGHPNAAFLLGQIYSKGDGIDPDREAAVRWFMAAHEGGRPDAAFMIGMQLAARAAELKRDGAADAAIHARAVQWLEMAVSRDPQPEIRERAKELLEMLALIR